MDGGSATDGSTAKKDDAALAIAILVVAVVTAILIGMTIWKRKSNKNPG